MSAPKRGPASWRLLTKRRSEPDCRRSNAARSKRSTALDWKWPPTACPASGRANTAGARSLLLLAQSQNKIVGGPCPHIAPAVLFTGRDVGYRARSQRSRAPRDGHFERALMDHDHLFVHMVVGRMRRLARPQLGHVQIDQEPGVRGPIEDRALAVRPVYLDRKVRTGIRLGRQRPSLRRGLSRGHDGK